MGNDFVLAGLIPVSLAVLSFFVLRAFIRKTRLQPLLSLCVFGMAILIAAIPVMGYFARDLGRLETVLLSPFALGWAIETAFASGLWTGMISAGLLAFGTLLVSMRTTRVLQLPALLLGALATVVIPVMLEEFVVSHSMSERAKTLGLRVAERNSFCQSLRSYSGFSTGHGIACGSGGQTYLWSYRNRDWTDVPEAEWWVPPPDYQ